VKLSTRATYGVRAMLGIALAPSGRPMMVKDIADQQELPPAHLEQLMAQLKKANLIASTRGAHGGYTLTRPASEITLFEVVVALEGSLDMTDCPSGGLGCCGHPESCAVQEVWAACSAALRSVLEEITLANLAERQRMKATSDVLMYHI
jgi:Rrf2 family protein